MKHTPGPWESAGSRIFQANSVSVIAADVMNSADRDLIAASPKMLHTLKKVHAQLVAWGKQNGMDFQLISAVEDTISEAEPGWRG